MTRRSDAKANTRAKVLAAATEMFTQRGYSGTDIRSIARHIGMSTGAVFASFSDKDELWREATGLPTPEEALAAFPRMVEALSIARDALLNTEDVRRSIGPSTSSTVRALSVVNAALPQPPLPTRQLEGAAA